MRVVVVYGPPLSGKTTYVRQRLGSNDIVYDFDLLMSAISGLPVHKHNDNLIGYVLDIRDLLISKLKNERRIDNAWIITTEVTSKLKQLLQGLSVEYVKLDVDWETAKARLYANPDGRDIATWERVLARHFRPTEQEDKSFYKTTAWKQKREAILKRDNCECQLCKAAGGFSKGTVVHHIQHLGDRPDLALEDSNLITVCEACHNREHPAKWFVPSENSKTKKFPEKW